MLNVKELVSTRLIEAAPRVRDRVIDMLVQDEQERRVAAVLKALKELEKLRREGFKLKPDVITYDIDGKIASESYSKAKAEEVKKNRESIAKLEVALAEALDDTSPSFDKVLKLSGGEKTEEKPAE